MHSCRFVLNKYKQNVILVTFLFWSQFPPLSSVAPHIQSIGSSPLSSARLAWLGGSGCWGRSIADKVCREPILLEDSSKVVNFLLKVVLRVDDPSSPVVETLHIGVQSFQGMWCVTEDARSFQ